MIRSNSLFHLLLSGLLLLGLLSGCGGGGSFPVFPTAIEISPAQPSIAAGTSVQFTATALYSNGTKNDITSSVLWKSSDTTVATINTQGLATSLKAGSTTITASLGSVTKSVILTVTTAQLESLQVSPTAASIALGTSQQFTATGTFSDNTTQDLTTQATWTSSNSGAASVGASGLAVSAATGVTTITATFGGIPAAATLTVTNASLQSVQVTPTNPSIAAGTTEQFKATGIFSDNTKQDLTSSATWSSSTSAASITGGGLATGMAAGNSVITATFGGKQGSSTLTVTSASLVSIEVTPLNPSIALGTTQQFAAIGTFSNNTVQDLTAIVTWVSSNTAVATVSNAAGTSGLAISAATGSTGSTTITAAIAGMSGQTVLTVTNAVLQSIDVEPADPTLPVGVQQQFTATGTFFDGTNYTVQDLTSVAAWSSDNTASALVSNSPGSKGLVTTISTGTPTITASFAGSTGSTQLTVIDDTLLEIQVTPVNPTIPLILTQQFTATGIYLNSPPVDLTAQATWSSSNTAIAVVSNDAATAGLAKPLSAGGPIIITATFAGTAGSTNLTVSPATLVSIAVVPASATIAKGTTQQFTATGTFSDSSTYDLTKFAVWTSSAPAVAAVSNAAGNQGLATGLTAGVTTITATFGGKSGTSALTVTPETLSSISITPANAIIAVKTTIRYTATGTFSGGTIVDLTRQVVWRSSNTGVATISNSTGTKGQATGVTAGGPITITASATIAGVTASGSTNLTVATGTLTSIAISPATFSITVGQTKQFQAIGTYTLADGVTTFQQDLTRQTVWSTTPGSVASSSNGVNQRGLITGVGVGDATISARKPSSNLPAGSITPATLHVTAP